MLSTKFKIIRVVFKNIFAATEMWPAGSKKWFFSNKGNNAMFCNKESLSYLMVVWENSQVFKYYDIVDNNKKKQSK